MRRFVVAIFLCFVPMWPMWPMWPTWASSEDNWTRWRGPRMDGIAHDSNPPIEWSETKNVRWKSRRSRTRILDADIWGDLLYVLTAIPTDGSTPPPPPHRNPDATQGRGRRRGAGPGCAG